MAQAATVLVADNDDEALRRQKEALSSEGFKVVTASGPDEAKEVLRSQQVDIAVLDIRLNDDDDETDISGIELAETEAPGVSKVLTTVWTNEKIISLAQRLKDEGKIEDWVPEKQTESILKVAWKTVAARARIQYLAAIQGFDDQSPRYLIPRRYSARVAALLLLLALGSAVLAVVLGDARWLLMMIAFVVLTIGSISIAAG
jgi:DNA-binding NarL/FixJ family response regulator